jgi:hypothetical protein
VQYARHFSESCDLSIRFAVNADGNGMVMGPIPWIEIPVSKTLANVIEFYIPNTFRKQMKWTPSEQRGKVLEFRSAEDDIRSLERERIVLPSRPTRWLRWP